MNSKIVYYNGFRFCRDDNTNYYLSSKLIDGQRKRLHRYVWECAKGIIPEGYDIHHIDTNKLNNDISNLELVLRKTHRKKHGELFSKDASRVEKARKILDEKARPKASLWHKTKAGHDWHKKNGKQTWIGRQKQIYVCKNCGNVFDSLKSYSENTNTFCSSACKSAYRRKQGLDIIDKNCVVCKSLYKSDKYSKTLTCSMQCRGRLRLMNKQKK